MGSLYRDNRCSVAGIPALGAAALASGPMPTLSVADVLAALGVRAPWDKAAGWDPVGLQIGDPRAPAGAVAVCHEVTEAVVDAADGLGLLVTYHPLLFRPTTRLLAGDSPEGRALELAARGTAVAVAHTSFDVASGGTADALGEALGLDDLTGFAPLWGRDSMKVVTYVPAAAADAVADAMAGAGGGRVGNNQACSFRTEGTSREAGIDFEEIRVEMNVPATRVDAVAAALVRSHPSDDPAYDVVERKGDAGFVGRVGTPGGPLTVGDLAARVVAALGGVIRVAGDPDRPVHRVAVIPGSGGDFGAAAAAVGADVLVTGDVGHHRARATLVAGVAVIDPGHVPTERPGVRKLYAAVSEVAGGAVDLTDLDASVWHEGSAWNS